MDGLSSKKKPIKMDDMGIPLFSETSISTKLITQSASGSQTWRPAFSVGKNICRRQGKGVGVSQNGLMNFV